MNDVVQTTRRGYLTSLPAALYCDAALLYVPRHVLGEVEKNLPAYCQKLIRSVDPDAAMEIWKTLYAPCIRVVDVPESWGNGDPRVQAVASRHSSDLPTAQLASALAECYVLARDGDLTDHFGKHEHLDLLLAAANQGEMNLIGQSAALPVMLGGLAVKGAVHGIRRLPGVAQVGALLILGGLTYYWQRDGRGARHLKQFGSAVGDLFEIVGPPLQELLDRRRRGEEAWTSHVVPRLCPPSMSEQVARILAFAPDVGMLAGEIADELVSPGSIKSRTAAVRTVLEECAAFTEVSRYRWRLGHPITAQPPELPTEMTIDWLRRAHHR